jgi:hypothetical protein
VHDRLLRTKQYCEDIEEPTAGIFSLKCTVKGNECLVLCYSIEIVTFHKSNKNENKC